MATASTTLKRLGAASFAFFFLKGMAWLTLAAAAYLGLLAR